MSLEQQLRITAYDARTVSCNIRKILAEMDEEIANGKRPTIASMRRLAEELQFNSEKLCSSLRPGGVIYDTVALLNERDAADMRRGSHK